MQSLARSSLRWRTIYPSDYRHTGGLPHSPEVHRYDLGKLISFTQRRRC